MKLTRSLLFLLLVALLAAACTAAPAAPASDADAGAVEADATAEPVEEAATGGDAALKIGMVSTLSGPASALGVDVHDGFMLGIKHVQEDMPDLGSIDVIVKDDQRDPDVANQAVEELLQREEVDFMTGIIFSNILLAVSDTVFDSETFYVSPNAGPSQLAGEGCSDFFVGFRLLSHKSGYSYSVKSRDVSNRRIQ